MPSAPELTPAGSPGIWRVTYEPPGTRTVLTAHVLLPEDGPAGAARELYLLHGRGGTSAELVPVLLRLQAEAAAGDLPTYVVVVPEAPWAGGSSYWLDSLHESGRPVESLMLRGLLPALTDVVGGAGIPRVVAGASMGGAAALRWALLHPELFGAAVLLTPAVYDGLPPEVSSMRRHGAFGRGRVLFDERRYAELSYSRLLADRPARDGVLPVAIVVGDREPAQEGADGSWRDLDLEAARLHAALKREPDIRSQLRVGSGGHDWVFWEAALVQGLRIVGGADGAAT